MVRVNIGKDEPGRIVVSFPYDSIIVSRVKAIHGPRWHPVEKHERYLLIAGIIKLIKM